jgi:hypothetical protein
MKTILTIVAGCDAAGLRFTDVSEEALVGAWLPCSWTQKSETALSSEMSVNLYWLTWRHSTVDSTLLKMFPCIIPNF